MEIDRYEIESFPPCGVVECKIESMHLLEGRYFLDVAAHTKDGIPYVHRSKCLEFSISSRVREIGVVRLEHRWNVREITEDA